MLSKQILAQKTFKENSYEIHYQKEIGITMIENSEEFKRREDEYKLSRH